MPIHTHIRPINPEDLGDCNQNDERQIWVHNTPKTAFTRVKGHHQNGFVYFDKDDQEWYLVKSEYASSKKFVKATLFHCIDETGKDFILPLLHPNPGQSESWYNSLSEILTIASKHYVKMRVNKQDQCFDLVSKKIVNPTPVAGGYTFAESLGAAFPGKFFVDYADHPLLLKLQGHGYAYEEIEEEDVF